MNIQLDELHQKHLMSDNDGQPVPVRCAWVDPTTKERCTNTPMYRPVFQVPYMSKRWAKKPNYAELEMSSLVVCPDHVCMTAEGYVGEEGILNWFRAMEAGGLNAVTNRPIRVSHRTITLPKE